MMTMSNCTSSSTSDDLDASNDEHLLLDKQMCFPLYSAANAVVRAYRPLLEVLDLTYLQYIVMMVLWQSDGVSVKDLGQRLHLDSGTLTPLLKRLEVKGLVLRKRGEHDERVRTLHLTAQGQELHAKAVSVPAEMFCKLKLAPEEMQMMKLLCEKLLLQLQ
ncbi:Organic hydroperoxide resistance transcriptional regulator [Vibrio palustris]|uniref:Organic hydroperoxide resistance transcriptional regulator n=2 Tax=Vibrio palustris TaxID=1918946 RepID=A0A1R4B673_9VIBR|nr:Organic hydroperoxide resistance transcriptional regulator [Vibrio palustris]